MNCLSLVNRRIPAVIVGLGAAMGLALSLTATAQPSDSAAPFGAPIGEDRLQAHALLDELEGRVGDGATPVRWDGEGWIGTDTDRLWLKSEGFAEHGAAYDDDAEVLYDRPITPYFDVQAGLRYDLPASGSRGWAAFGIEGLAPYLVQISATVYGSDAGHYAARIVATRDLLLTQRLILEPRLELNEYTRADSALGAGAGISDIDAGLRLRCEITRKIAPYIGAAWQRLQEPSPGHSDSAWTAVFGLRVWF